MPKLLPAPRPKHRSGEYFVTAAYVLQERINASVEGGWPGR